MPKFAPDTATLAVRNLRRRCSRAAIASRRGSSVRSAGASAISARKMSRTSVRLRWIAGTRMCDGLSCASWTMSSARSVSTAAMPRSSRYSLSPISWVAIDLTLSTSVAPVARTSSVTIRFASSASTAQCTTPPLAVTFASSCSSSSGIRAITSVLIAEPAVPQRLPVGHLADNQRTLGLDGRRGVGQIAAQLTVGELLLRCLRKRLGAAKWDSSSCRRRRIGTPEEVCWSCWVLPGRGQDRARDAPSWSGCRDDSSRRRYASGTTNPRPSTRWHRCSGRS